MSTPARRFSVRTLLIEFSVIVLGVFVALAAETWWSGREGRLLEQQLREDMVAEFASNIRILEADLEDNRTLASDFQALVGRSDEELAAPDDAWWNRTVRPFPNWAGFDPEIGIVQALINSGSLSNISDADLRIRLARWAGLLREDERKTGLATDFQMHVLLPAIATIAADGTWSPEERLQARLLYDSMTVLLSGVMNSQQALLEEARSIHAFLGGLESPEEHRQGRREPGKAATSP